MSSSLGGPATRGVPRAGHLEGTVRAHIDELECNLDALRPKLSEEYWKLRLAVRYGRECVDAVQQRRHDLILFDVNRTTMNGFETLEQIRRNTPHMSIDMLTATDDAGTHTGRGPLGQTGSLARCCRTRTG
ncbi:response regulator [Limnoglobus roseus]|uniref:response regulator n=1 Tax=Limnoglobus roseus TaxID=2598579 RepID=UPI00143DB605|nr:response regulator [Limnoglobus roseus]